jgi:hypothetical protein
MGNAGLASLMIDPMPRSSRPLPQNRKKPFQWAGQALAYAMIFYPLWLR